MKAGVFHLETLIKKLVEVDKVARRQVEEAERKKEEVILELQKTKKELSSESEAAFSAALKKAKEEAEKKAQTDFSAEKIELLEKEAKEKLEAVYAEKSEKWVQEIYEKVIG